MPYRPFPKKKTTTPPLFESEKPPQSAVIAYIDGGARGNPGPAGYGVYLTDLEGRKIEELSEYLGERTNNFAEYSALLAALERAQQHGYNALRVFSDSELIVKQMKGIYKVSHPDLKPMHERARTLSRKLEWFDIVHVRRELNKDADRLANLAMDRGTGAKSGPARPAEVTGVVRHGVVELDRDLPEGTRVRVKPV